MQRGGPDGHAIGFFTGATRFALSALWTLQQAWQHTSTIKTYYLPRSTHTTTTFACSRARRRGGDTSDSPAPSPNPGWLRGAHMNPTRHAPLGPPAVGRASSGPDKRHSQPALHGLAVAIPQLASWPPLRARQVAIHVYWMEAVEPIRRACATQGPHLFVGSGASVLFGGAPPVISWGPAHSRSHRGQN